MRMNITKKLLFSFVSILFLLGIISFLSYSAISYFNESLSLDNKISKKIALINEMETMILNEHISVTYAAANTNANDLKEMEKFNELFKSKSEELTQMEANNSSIEELISLEEQLMVLARELTQVNDQSNEQSYGAFLENSSVILSQASEVAQSIRMTYQTEISESNLGLIAATEISNKIILIVSIIAIIFGLVVALFISRIISKPLKLIANAADEVSQGNLLIDEITVKNKDEIGQLAISFNLMIQNLRNLILNVKDTSGTVAASAEQLMISAEQTTSSTNQVTNAIQEVASGSEIQGKSTEESANSIKELAVGIEQIANTANSLTESTSITTEQANNGNDMLQKVITQIQSINHTTIETNQIISELDINSKKIGKIIDIITDVSEQTNLLALNAAIESARAGEHGKGFAVVADEVRKLAEQSRNSAIQISKLVEYIQNDISTVVSRTKTSSAQVSSGLSLVKDTGESFEKILLSVNKVDEEIAQLSVFSNEMSERMEDVNLSIKEVSIIANNATSSTAEIAASSEEQLATMEEVSLSAGNLSKSAENLRNLINKFKL